jgi:hypothetical protein
MSGLPVALAIGAAAIVVLGGGEIAPEPARPLVPALRIEAMPFAECTSLMTEIAQDMEVDPTELVRTSDLWLSRLVAADGVVVVSCSRTDGKLTILTVTDHAVAKRSGAPTPASS